jgi:hypothetical protein
MQINEVIKVHEPSSFKCRIGVTFVRVSFEKKTTTTKNRR